MSFPTHIQPDAMDCGPTCLQIITRHYNRSIQLTELRIRSFTTREGSSLLGLSDAAESLGFHSTGVKLTWSQLRDEAPLPCIVHWNQNHFVVVYKIARRRGRWYVYVSDPAAGLLILTLVTSQSRKTKTMTVIISALSVIWSLYTAYCFPYWGSETILDLSGRSYRSSLCAETMLSSQAAIEDIRFCKQKISRIHPLYRKTQYDKSGIYEYSSFPSPELSPFLGDINITTLQSR